MTELRVDHVRMLAFLLIFLRKQSFSVEDVSTQTDGYREINSTTENANNCQSLENSLDAVQTQKINQFSTDFIFVSEL